MPCSDVVLICTFTNNNYLNNYLFLSPLLSISHLYHTENMNSLKAETLNALFTASPSTVPGMYNFFEWMENIYFSVTLRTLFNLWSLKGKIQGILVLIFTSSIIFIFHILFGYFLLLPFMWFTRFFKWGVSSLFVSAFCIFGIMLEIFFHFFIYFIHFLFACLLFYVIKVLINFYVIRFIGFHLNFLIVRKAFFTLRF